MLFLSSLVEEPSSAWLGLEDSAQGFGMWVPVPAPSPGLGLPCLVHVLMPGIF